MGRSNDMFSPSGYHRTRGIRISAISAVMMVLSAISVILAIWVILNFEEVTAGAAISVAEFLTSGIPVLIIIAAVIFLRVKMKWSLFRHIMGG